MIITQRHRKILEALGARSSLSVAELVRCTGSSPATVRRDLRQLDSARRLRKVRGGAEAIGFMETPRLSGSSFEGNAGVRLSQKRAIARRAVDLCHDDEAVIINGGTTTYRMADFMDGHHIKVLTNSFAMADRLIRYTRNDVVLPGGDIYREQNIILSPYERDTTIDHFHAARLFSGAFAIRSQGMIETDPLLIKAEQKLIRQADELVVLVDSSKFRPRGSLILCPLERINVVITDDGVSETAVAMLEDAGVEVIVARSDEDEDEVNVA